MIDLAGVVYEGSEDIILVFFCLMVVVLERVRFISK